MKDGGVQFMEVYNWFIDNGADLRNLDIWLDVEIGLWGPNQTYNQGVIQDYVDAAVVSRAKNSKKSQENERFSA